MRPDFDKAQNAATKLLLTQDINSLYIDAREFKLPRFIIIDSMQRFCALTEFPMSQLSRSNIAGACLLRQDDYRIILYDDDIQNEKRKHWGITHELGHVLLGHKDDSAKSEIEANFFAAQIVAPEIVLLDIVKRQGSISDYDLHDHFNISFEAASKRIQTLNRRPCFNCGTIDKQLLDRFEPILEKEFGGKKVS